MLNYQRVNTLQKIPKWDWFLAWCSPQTKKIGLSHSSEKNADVPLVPSCSWPQFASGNSSPSAVERGVDAVAPRHFDGTSDSAKCPRSSHPKFVLSTSFNSQECQPEGKILKTNKSMKSILAGSSDNPAEFDWKTWAQSQKIPGTYQKNIKFKFPTYIYIYTLYYTTS